MIYFLHAPEVGRIKIGYSKDWQTRLLDFMVGCPTNLDLLVCAVGTQEQERALHKIFAPYHWRGEWFSATPKLLAFCTMLRETPEPMRQIGIAEAISNAKLVARSRLHRWDIEEETDQLRSCVAAFIEKHGEAATRRIARVTERSVGNWRRKSHTIGGVQYLRLLAFDGQPFEPFTGFKVKTRCNELRDVA